MGRLSWVVLHHQGLSTTQTRTHHPPHQCPGARARPRTLCTAPRWRTAGTWRPSGGAAV